MGEVVMFRAKATVRPAIPFAFGALSAVVRTITNDLEDVRTMIADSEAMTLATLIRGTGLGTSFLRKVEEYFGEKYLFVNVKKSDREAVVALLKLGFDIVGQILTEGEICSTIILRKTCGS